MRVVLTLSFFLVLAFEIKGQDYCSQDLLGFEELDQILTIERGIAEGFSGPTVHPDLVELAVRFDRLNQCPEQVWPDHKIDQTPARMIDGHNDLVVQYDSEQKSWRPLRSINDEDRRNHSYEFDKDGDGGITVNATRYLTSLSSGPSGPPPGGPPGGPRLCPNENQARFAFMQAHTQRSELSGLDRLMTFTAHENFHNVDQDPKNPVHQHTQECRWHKGSHFARGLSANEGEVSLLRQQLMNALYKAYQAPKGSQERERGLAQVRGWSEKFAGQYPDEFAQLRGVDRIEGTAEYVGMMSSIIGSLGCEPDQSQKHKLILEHLKDRFTPMVQSVDQQSYFIGAVFGLLLDDLEVDSWKEQVMTTEASPLDLFLELSPKLPPAAQTLARNSAIDDSQAIEEDVNNCMSEEVKKAVDPIVQSPQDYILVQLEPVSYRTSGGFVAYEVEDESVNISLLTSSQGEHFSVSEATMLGLPELCQNPPHNFVAVPRRLIEEGSLTLSDNSEGLRGTIPAPGAERPQWREAEVRCQ